MKITKYVPLIVVMVAVLASAGWAGAGESVCPRFAISSVEEPDVMDIGKYSAVNTTDIKVHVVFPTQFKEEHVISLLFYTPAGHLYRQIDVPVTPEIGREGTQSRRLPGYPYPVTVAVPEVDRAVSATSPSIEVRFPVGGTSILTSSLYGMWRVNGMVDGVELRCFRPMSFGIGQ